MPSEIAWSVPIRVEDVPESGRHARLVADAETRAAIAKAIGVLAVDTLNVEFDVTRHGRAGLRVKGALDATVSQACVVTLEPVSGRVQESVDLRFTPDAAETALSDTAEIPENDPPEPMIGGGVDLGAISVEFLALGLDPYPRKPGAVFAVPGGGNEGRNPFAALAALKKEAGRQDD